MPWYGLYCRSNTEKVVSRRLADAGIEAYYPHLVVPSRKGKRETETKFFPGYCFARFDLEHRLPVARIPEVVRILGWQDKPVAIPDYEIEAVRTMVTTPVPVNLQPAPFVSEGDRVAVTRGPLRGLEGFVVYCKNETRVVVSVTLLARSISAEVDAAWLRKLDPLKAAA